MCILRNRPDWARAGLPCWLYNYLDDCNGNPPYWEHMGYQLGLFIDGDPEHEGLLEMAIKGKRNSVACESAAILCSIQDALFIAGELPYEIELAISGGSAAVRVFPFLRDSGEFVQ